MNKTATLSENNSYFRKNFGYGETLCPHCGDNNPDEGGCDEQRCQWCEKVYKNPTQ